MAGDSAFAKAKRRSGYDIPEEYKRVYRTEGGTPALDNDYTVFGEVVKGTMWWM